MNNIEMETTKYYVKSLLFEAIRGKKPDGIYEIMSKAAEDTDITREAYEILYTIKRSIFTLKDF